MFKGFWQTIAINAFVRSTSVVFVWLTAQGYIPAGKAGAVASMIGVVLFNIVYTLANNAINRYHIDLARFLPQGVDRVTLFELAAETGVLSKISQGLKNETKDEVKV